MFVIFWFFLASSIFFSAVRSFDLLGRKTYYRNGRGRYLSDTGEVEDFFPKFHRCLDAGEAYSASYFMTKKYLIARKTDNNLTWVNCEMGSLIMVSQSRRYVNRAIGGIVQSLDILDFSVIHLSAYERLIKRHWRKLQKGEKSYSVVDVVREAVRRLNYKSTISPEFSKAPFQLNRTVAIMPFLGSVNGAGHSVLENRYQYLAACFWSVYSYMPHVVVTVTSEKDYNYCRHKSGLPFFDVLWLTHLPKVASLPVATSQEVKARLMDGRYDFDHVYYTESDQILLMRDPQVLYSILEKFPNYVLLPHRLMPYPDSVMKAWVGRPAIKLASTNDPSAGHNNVSDNANLHEDDGEVDSYASWKNVSCCLPSQRCTSRESWVSVQSTAAPIVQIYGLNVALGNTNFLKEHLRACVLHTAGRLQTCP